MSDRRWRYRCGCLIQGRGDHVRPRCKWHDEPIRTRPGWRTGSVSIHPRMHAANLSEGEGADE